MIYKYAFKSSSGSAVYTTRLDTDTGDLSCNCRGWIFKRFDVDRGCKHTREVTAKMEQKHSCSAPKGVPCTWCGATPFLGEDTAAQAPKKKAKATFAEKPEMPVATATIGGKKYVEPIVRVNGLWKVGGKLYATKESAELGFVNQMIADDAKKTADAKAAAMAQALKEKTNLANAISAKQFAKLATAMSKLGIEAGVVEDAFIGLGGALSKVPVSTGTLKQSVSPKNPIMGAPMASRDKAPAKAGGDVVALRRKRRIDFDE